VLRPAVGGPQLSRMAVATAAPWPSPSAVGNGYAVANCIRCAAASSAAHCSHAEGETAVLLALATWARQTWASTMLPSNTDRAPCQPPPPLSSWRPPIVSGKLRPESRREQTCSQPSLPPCSTRVARLRGCWGCGRWASSPQCTAGASGSGQSVAAQLEGSCGAATGRSSKGMCIGRGRGSWGRSGVGGWLARGRRPQPWLNPPTDPPTSLWRKTHAGPTVAGWSSAASTGPSG
jgi:hypothetical protein